MFFDFSQLSFIEIGLCCCIVFLAYAIKGFSGFGSGLIAIPLLAFVFPLKLIVPVLGLLSYGGTVIQSIQLRRHVVWQEIYYTVPFAIIGISVALWLLLNVDSNILVFFLGVFVCGYSVYSLVVSEIPAMGRKWSALAGLGGGMVGALFGTGGPFYVLYLKMRKFDKTHFRATIAMIFLFDGGVRITGYGISGLYTQQVLWLVILLVPILLAGLYVGNHIHLKINQAKFNRLISVLLLFSGGMLVYRSSIFV